VYSLGRVGLTLYSHSTTRLKSVPECSPAWRSTLDFVPRISNQPPNSTLHPTAGAGVGVGRGKVTAPAAGERGR
jgi:hypothetical protein